MYPKLFDPPQAESLKESFWYTSTLGHYEEGKGKNLFWGIDGIGATYTDSFIWT